MSKKGVSMARRFSRLPSRFPVGTKLVIEGRRAGEGKVHVIKRYLEFLDGTHMLLPTRPARRPRYSASEPAQRAEQRLCRDGRLGQ